MSKRIQLVNLYTSSFPDSKQFVDNFFSKYYVSKNVMCYTDNGKILSALHLSSKNLFFYNKIWRLPFIVGAATLKEHRNHGIFTKLIKKTYSRLSSTNTPFVMLYPAENCREMYEKFGFVTVTYCSHKTISYDDRDAEEVNYSSEQLMDFFNCWSSEHYQTYQYRNPKEMDKTLERWAVEDIYPHVYVRDGKTCYVAMSDKEIEEVVGDVEVLNGVKNLDGKTVEDFSGEDKPYAMARLISPSKLLDSLEYTADGEYNFKVVDPFFPSINAMLSLSIYKGRPIVTFGEHSDFEIDGKDLLKLAFGMDIDCPLSKVVSKKKPVFIDKY